MSVDPRSVDPAAFARQVASTPDEQLRAGMESEARALVLDGIFDAMARHFEPAKAQGTEAVIHFSLDNGRDVYELAIEDGRCEVAKEPSREPRVTFSLDSVDFLKLVTGNANGPEMFMTGRLQVAGDVMFAAGLQSLFRVPT